METHFILDTNAYRRISEMLTFSAIRPTTNEMRIRERKKASKSLMSVLVSMELLRHFDDTDPDFHDCFKALALQYHHTQSNFGGPNNKIDFIPPVNTIITKHFFNDNSPYIKYYYRTVEIVENATKNLDTDDYKRDESDIKIIGAQLLHEKAEIKENFEEFIKSYNGGVVDWNFFKKDETVKPKLLKDIKSGRLLGLLAEAMLHRAHNILELTYPQGGLEGKFDDFLKFYHPLLNLNQVLFSKMLDGVVSLADPKNVKWNTHNDMQIVAAACYASYRERANDVRVILVTNDKGIHTGCQGTYMENNVWTLSQYQAFIY